MKTVTVVGGGLIGLATAWKLQRRGDVGRVIVLEKEQGVARHQSSHNSGVLHAGIYYAPGSLKARLAVGGLREMIAFCRQHGIAHEQCGKVVVATDDTEVERLKALLERGRQNGLANLRWLSPQELREIEPNAAGVAAVHVPEEGIADYPAVARKLESLIQDRGGEVRLASGLRSATKCRNGWSLRTDSGTIETDFLVNCAGLYSDRVARLAGEYPDVRIVPFRGEYYTLRPDRAHLVRNLIYPVPDPGFPFLGVHFTRMIHGGVEAGPNAVLAGSREGYRKRDIRPAELGEALTFPGLWRFLRKHPSVVTYEIARSLSSGIFLKSLQRLLPAIRRGDIVRGMAGVRAQAMRRDGSLLQDFEILTRERAIHVLNAPSPGATASLAIGQQIASLLPASS